MIEEIKKLRRSGVNWKRLDEFGLEYRYVNCYVRGLISYEELIKQLQNAIHHFAKRQMTWFKRNPQIIWVKSDGQAESLLKKFLA
jgi:tRNA dimethylallyltransferase